MGNVSMFGTHAKKLLSGDNSSDHLLQNFFCVSVCGKTCKRVGEARLARLWLPPLLLSPKKRRKPTLNKLTDCRIGDTASKFKYADTQEIKKTGKEMKYVNPLVVVFSSDFCHLVLFSPLSFQLARKR